MIVYAMVPNIFFIRQFQKFEKKNFFFSNFLGLKFSKKFFFQKCLKLPNSSRKSKKKFRKFFGHKKKFQNYFCVGCVIGMIWRGIYPDSWWSKYSKMVYCRFGGESLGYSLAQHTVMTIVQGFFLVFLY